MKSFSWSHVNDYTGWLVGFHPYNSDKIMYKVLKYEDPGRKKRWWGYGSSSTEEGAIQISKEHDAYVYGYLDDDDDLIPIRKVLEDTPTLSWRVVDSLVGYVVTLEPKKDPETYLLNDMNVNPRFYVAIILDEDNTNYYGYFHSYNPNVTETQGYQTSYNDALNYIMKQYEKHFLLDKENKLKRKSQYLVSLAKDGHFIVRPMYKLDSMDKRGWREILAWQSQSVDDVINRIMNSIQDLLQRMDYTNAFADGDIVSGNPVPDCFGYTIIPTFATQIVTTHTSDTYNDLTFYLRVKGNNSDSVVDRIGGHLSFDTYDEEEDDVVSSLLLFRYHSVDDSEEFFLDEKNHIIPVIQPLVMQWMNELSQLEIGETDEF